MASSRSYSWEWENDRLGLDRKTPDCEEDKEKETKLLEFEPKAGICLLYF
ncbi:hypothetical protein CHCC14821_1641 [Bacillus paralicheniformis]|nr:hypothetical protein CHCC14821_1641 [Bacillus paralicheniformis]